jgi:hypothetical protein
VIRNPGAKFGNFRRVPTDGQVVAPEVGSLRESRNAGVAMRPSGGDRSRIVEPRKVSLMSPLRWRFRSCSSHTLTVALAFALLTAAVPAHAEEQDAPVTEQTAEEVATLLDAAVERFAAGDLEGARESFAAAWRLRKDVTIASNLADIEMKLGRYRDAAEHLSFCVRHATDESVRREAARRLADCRPFVGNVHVTVDTQAATVLLDGAPIGHAPIERELWLAPGTHTLQAQHQGRSSAMQTLQVRGGDEVKIELKLAPSVAPAPPANAIKPKPQKAGAPTRAAAPDSTNELKFYSMIGGSVVGAAALGAGLLWTFSANSSENSANALLTRVKAEGDPSLAETNGSCSVAASSPPAECGQLKGAWESVDRSRNLATGAFITGGVLLAGTVAAYFFWPEGHEPTRKATLDVAPWSQGEANGVQLSGSF